MALGHALSKVGLRQIMAKRAESEGIAIEQMCVAIKPSFMFAFSQTNPSNYVEPELLLSLVEQLHAIGCKRVAILESSIYEDFFQHASVQEVSTYIGLVPRDNVNFELVDTSKEQVQHEYSRGMGIHTISQTWKDAHLRIVFGKMVSHPTDMCNLTTSVHYGLTGSAKDRIFVERVANRQAAGMMVLDNFPSHLALLDAYNSAADGMVGMIACKNPLQPLRIYAGEDALAVDAVASRHLGMDPLASDILSTALHWFGDPVVPVTVHGVDEPILGWRGPLHNGYRAFCQLLAAPTYEHLSGRGQLFLPPMDARAFPAIESPSCCFSGLRIVVRWLVGIQCR